jgi:hypothetical protein
MPPRALIVLVAVVVLAGCRGGHEDRSAAVLRGAARSPFSYLFYDRRWWGRDPDVRVLALHVRGRHAQLVLIARSGVRQHLELVLGKRHAWRVVIPAGGHGIVSGPQTRRRAPLPWTECANSDTFVSRLDASWGLVRPHCPSGNGVILLHREHGSWTVYDEASDPFDCTEAPPGVIRSLTGACLTE